MPRALCDGKRSWIPCTGWTMGNLRALCTAAMAVTVMTSTHAEALDPTETEPSLPVSVAVDMSSLSPFEHTWKRSWGSGHAALTLRDDWRQHLKRAVDDLGLQGVRCESNQYIVMGACMSRCQPNLLHIIVQCLLCDRHNNSTSRSDGRVPTCITFQHPPDITCFISLPT